MSFSSLWIRRTTILKLTQSPEETTAILPVFHTPPQNEQRLTETEVHEILTELERASHFNLTTKIPSRFANSFLIGAWCAFVLSIFGFVLAITRSPIAAQLVATVVGVGGSIYYTQQVVPSRLKDKKNRAVLLRIEEAQDVRFIAPLVDLWVGGENLNYALGCEILPTLTTLFPLLNAENAEALPIAQRKLIYAALSPKTSKIARWQEKVSEESYVLCVVEAVRALTRIGDTAALPTLRSLLSVKGETQWHQQIRAVVGECLLKLELIAKEETSAKVLLRPSTFEDRTGDTLLRPTPVSPEDHPETLLRAVDGQEKGEGEEN